MTPRLTLRTCIRIPLFVGLLVMAAGIVLVPGAARACACGGAYPIEGQELQAGEEVALLSWDGQGRERMEMSLSLTGDADRMAVVVPTPAVPEVEQGSSERLEELARLATPPPPEEEEEEHDGDGAAAAPPGPTVVSRTVLDDVVATVIRGGTSAGVVRWLEKNGYAQKPAVEPIIDDYLADGWVFTAIKLRTDEPPEGPVAPIVLTFDSEQLVYPMRMNSAAEEVSPVTLYLLGDHFLGRDDETAGEQEAELDGAVTLEEDDVDDDVVDDVVEEGDVYLTAWTYEATDPADYTSDFTFDTMGDVEATHELRAGSPTAISEGDVGDTSDEGVPVWLTATAAGAAAGLIVLGLGAIVVRRATRR